MSEDTTRQDGAEGTEQLTEIPSSEDVPKNIVSERMDVTPEVLEQHYDARDKEEKRSNREKYLEDLDDD